ncbi:MAG: RpiB/LacA/LacB family sugar-phosphate isomerase [Bdellovibrionaceae bacterium]|nr:RpiB/LacA/LacB family sugar-phosphate isomerase [Pseudobdellovibrionaceae bacterium]
MKTIWIASDHAGFELKEDLIQALNTSQKHFKIENLGCFSTEPVDYPDFANKVALSLEKKAWDEGFGILICGSGQGMAMRANKFPWIRAALVWNRDAVQLAREHNNANVLVMGSRWTNTPEALAFVLLFSETTFAEGRHSTRVAKVSSLL